MNAFASFLSKVKAVTEVFPTEAVVEMSHADVAFSEPAKENNGVLVDAFEEFLSEEEIAQHTTPACEAYDDLYNAVYPKVERKKVTTKTGKELDLITVKFPFNPRAIGIEIDMKDWRWYGAFGCWAKKESPEAKQQASHFGFEFMTKLAALGK